MAGQPAESGLCQTFEQWSWVIGTGVYVDDCARPYSFGLLSGKAVTLMLHEFNICIAESRQGGAFDICDNTVSGNEPTDLIHSDDARMR